MPQTVSVPFDAAQLVALAPGETVRRYVRLAPNQSLRRGTALADTNAAPGLYRPYRPGANDGSGVPKLLLEVDCATDAQGNVSLGTLVAGSSPCSQTFPKAYAFEAGTFRCEDIVGLDAAGAAALGRVIEGSLSSGVFRMP